MWEGVGGGPGMPIRVGGTSGVSGTIGVSGVHPTVRSIVDNDALQLKSNLQHVIEEELSDLFHAYQFRIVKAVAEHNFYKDCHSFIIGVSSPMVNSGSALCVSYDVTRHDLYDKYVTASPSIYGSPAFYHAFRVMARNLRKAIENCTKEMPMMTGIVTGMSNNSAWSSNSYSIGTYTAPTQIVQAGSSNWGNVNINPEQIQSMSNPHLKKKSKFEFIDKLIEESKARLIGHAQPQFAFKYF
jgi:hypothetical protein